MGPVDWTTWFLGLAKYMSTRSKDPSTKCGAVVADGKFIISTGYNGFPSRIEDKPEDYLNRELKYQKVIHAEINAILNARQRLDGFTLYVWPFPPCARCSTEIIQSGIDQVIAPLPSKDLKERWGDSIIIAEDMFEEAGVKYTLIK